MLTVPAALVRAAVIASATGTATWSVGAALVAGLRLLADRPLAAVPAQTWVELLVLAAGTLAGTWLVVSAALLAAVEVLALAGRPTRRWRAAAGRCAPPLLRRLVVVGVGSALGLAPQVALAAEVDLGWAPETASTAPLHPPATIQRSEAPQLMSASSSAPAAGATPPPETAGHAVTVERGDTLWSISREALGAAGAPDDDASVAQAWPLLWAHNREAVGRDPDLIRPGQVLTLPTDLTITASTTAATSTEEIP